MNEIDMMRNIPTTVGLVVLVLGISLTSGCSPASDSEEEGDVHAKTTLAVDAAIMSGLDVALNDFVLCFKAGDVRLISSGNTIAEKIVHISDVVVRTNCLEKFRRTILSVSPEGDDYTAQNNGVGALERVHDLYLETLSRCGGDWEQATFFRLDFLKWLAREMERPHAPEPVSRGRRGLFVSRDMYQRELKAKYDLYLRWLEEDFNYHAKKEPSKEGIDRVRRQIEDTIKRRIRTDDEILRDRRKKPQKSTLPVPSSSQREVDVSVEI